MTPTTAEQMPDFRLIRKMLETRAYALTGGCPIAKEQVERLTSWLAQGGARGGDAALHLAVCQAVQLMQTGVPFMDHAELIKAQDILRESLIAYADAALAPRAEAGEAVQCYRPNTPCPTPESCRDNACGAVERELFANKEPTAACGVSGLVGKWPEADPVTDPTWRISPKFLISVMDNAEEPVSMEQVEAVLLAATRLFNECTPELEAALKANRGGVSDEPVAWQYQHAETGRSSALINDGVNNPSNFAEHNPRLIYVGPLYRHAALNAGAMAGGEVVEGEPILEARFWADSLAERAWLGDMVVYTLDRDYQGWRDSFTGPLGRHVCKLITDMCRHMSVLSISAHQQMMAAPEVMRCTMDCADFEADTITLSMDGKYWASAGQYVLLKAKDYDSLVVGGVG